jgi:hypothetical protein
LIDVGLIRAGKIRADDGRIDPMHAFNENFLRKSGRTDANRAKRQTRGQDEPSKIPTKKMHLAQVPHSRWPTICSSVPFIFALCKPRTRLANSASVGFRSAACASDDQINLCSTLFAEACKRLLTEYRRFPAGVTSTTRFLVDQSLTPSPGDQTQDVVRRRKYDQHGDQSDADAQADFLGSLAQRTPAQRLDGVK